jgi:hypothetical protein
MQLTEVIYLNYSKYVIQYLSFGTYSLFGREITVRVEIRTS